MRVLVTGGTGYIGQAVTARLREGGHQVVALARSPQAETLARRAGASTVRGDLGDAGLPAELPVHLAGCDGVVHLASPGDATSGAVDAAFVAAALAALGGTGRPLVYTSGLWVHGNAAPGAVLDENAAVRPTPLVAWRPANEARVLAAEGLRGISVRPGVVFGHGGGIPAMLTASARQHGTVRHVGDGGNRWSPVHVDDLADLYLRALEQAPAGAAYLGVSGEVVTVRDAAEAAAKGAGVPGRVGGWPVAQAREAMGPFADALALDQPATGAKARRELGWTPEAPGLLHDLEFGSYADTGAAG